MAEQVDAAEVPVGDPLLPWNSSSSSSKMTNCWQRVFLSRARLTSWKRMRCCSSSSSPFSGPLRWPPAASGGAVSLDASVAARFHF